MKKTQLHIDSFLIWLALPFFFFTSCIMAHTTERTCVSLSFSKTEKSTPFSIKNTSEPIGEEFPENSPTENHVISNTDIENIVDFFMIKNIFFFTACHLYNPTRVTINYKETYNMRFYPDIVSPPPKI